MNYIDLFAGAGGLSEGFLRQGYNPIAHVEIDEAACYSLRTRVAYHHLKRKGKYDIYVKYLKGEITRKELYKEIPEHLLDSVINLPIGAEFNDKIYRLIDKELGDKQVDLIIGGPPCQAYSVVGRARSSTGMKGDRRNYLYVPYAKFLDRYKPKMFVFENVWGIKSAGGGIYLENMEKLFLKKGYKMQLFELEANHFGVLQNRKRIIIIGWQEGFDLVLPDLKSVRIESDFKVRDILKDLPKIPAGGGKDKYQLYKGKSNDYLEKGMIRNGIDILTQHISRPNTEQDKEIYRIAVTRWNESQQRLDYNDLPEELKTHSNRSSFFDRFKVVAADLPWSHTVVAHIAKDGHYYIHPDIEQNRSLTVREAARLQSFPDDYYFEGVKEGGSRTAAFKQIGNAVPPLMAAEIAKRIKKLIKACTVD
ncbi:DNA (cytosine-5)-methyltransferase 1 [Chitinophaga niastensis]|uniref:Cytosine-specific methyltransferase n=1 Tax=Chitinophaga niastensis TaxID=536980 RepID=A0A2P8HTE1_CHINA|nr:DNA cytosine methyltransferase [Chitinophaga niastensis]PSL49501.1 DNA (cytosine-5)-methyltransferase 1 [Chitinophaga niastensis]